MTIWNLPNEKKRIARKLNFILTMKSKDLSEHQMITVQEKKQETIHSD